MFSSNPFPCSTNVFSPADSFFEHEKSKGHFNYHHPIDNPFISGDFAIQACNCLAPPPPISEDVPTFKQDFAIQQQFSERYQDQDDLLDSVVSPVKKKMAPSMKDGHSKIYTARGPRDRRVRLSIEIARKFFCLQDLLGFDKASKTLDWLFAKSLSSIKDLVEKTNHCSSSMATGQSFLETIKRDSHEENGPRKKKTTQRCKAGSQDRCSRYQSRTEARARARERTKAKLGGVKKFNDCWGQVKRQNDRKDISSGCIMDQETSKLSKDSSFQIRAFLEQLGDPAVKY